LTKEKEGKKHERKIGNLDKQHRIVIRLTRNMVFDPACEEQRKQFFRQGYGAHLPG